jgi:hypothetical protein
MMVRTERRSQVLACKSGLGTNMMNEVAYANTRGISVRFRMYTYYANGRYVNAWSGWSAFAEMPSGQYLGPTQINPLPDGKYLFESQCAKLVGGVWQYRSEYVPVYQYNDGFINPSSLLWATLPTNATCQLGSQFVVTW